MGHKVLRVRLDFDFPVDSRDRSYAEEAYEAHRRQCGRRGHDKCAWSRRPPEGDGWQLWQDVSDAPVSPVFASGEALVEWMCEPVPPGKRTHFAPEAYPARPWSQGWDRATAQKIVFGGAYAPCLMALDGRPLTSAEAVDAGRRGGR